MAISFPAIIDHLGIELSPCGIVSRTPGINCLGIIEAIPANILFPVGVKSYLWHAEVGWASIDRMELERWMVDAPAGCHFLVSERRLVETNRLPTRDDITLVLWSPKLLANWLGECLLSGALTLQIDDNSSDSIESLSERSARSAPSLPPSAIALRPKLRLGNWLSQQGYDQLPVRPLLLEGRLWKVSGDLVGPEKTREHKEWTILDDPFSGELSNLENIDSLDFVPHLERLTPSRWRGEGALRAELNKVCQERRHWRVKEASDSGEIQGSILHWWKIDEKSAQLSSSQVLIPGWQVEFPDEGWRLVHGLSGKVVSLPTPM